MRLARDASAPGRRNGTPQRQAVAPRRPSRPARKGPTINTHFDLAKVLEEALVGQVADQTFVNRLNSYAGGSQRLDVVSIGALSDVAPHTHLGVELALREEFSGRREFFVVRIERGEVVLPHPSAARTLLAA